MSRPEDNRQHALASLDTSECQTLAPRDHLRCLKRLVNDDGDALSATVRHEALSRLLGYPRDHAVMLQLDLRLAGPIGLLEKRDADLTSPQVLRNFEPFTLQPADIPGDHLHAVRPLTERVDSPLMLPLRVRYVLPGVDDVGHSFAQQVDHGISLPLVARRQEPEGPPVVGIGAAQQVEARHARRPRIGGRGQVAKGLAQVEPKQSKLFAHAAEVPGVKVYRRRWRRWAQSPSIRVTLRSHASAHEAAPLQSHHRGMEEMKL